jgi:hypothetical protein
MANKELWKFLDPMPKEINVPKEPTGSMKLPKL